MHSEILSKTSLEFLLLSRSFRKFRYFQITHIYFNNDRNAFSMIIFPFIFLIVIFPLFYEEIDIYSRHSKAIHFRMSIRDIHFE